MRQFFGDLNPASLNIPSEIAIGLSNEWLLFDYIPPSGKTLIIQYYFANPDNLSKALLNELKQVVETHHIHIFQTFAPSKPPYVFLQSVFTDTKFKVYDCSMSLVANGMSGSFVGRLTQIDKVKYLVGSNPMVFPNRYTSNEIHILAEKKAVVPSLP